MWATVEIVFIVLGLLLAFLGNQFSLPLLLDAGIVCFGLAMIAAGWQAILTQNMVLRSRRGGYRGTYTGIPAIFQGMQLNFAGLFLIGIALMTHISNGREIFLQTVRRPGLLLVLLGGLCLLQAAIRLWGVWEPRQSSGAMELVELFAARLLPGLILAAIGLILSLLGVFEAVAPARFDELGGGWLEQLYGLD